MSILLRGAVGTDQDVSTLDLWRLRAVTDRSFPRQGLGGVFAAVMVTILLIGGVYWMSTSMDEGFGDVQCALANDDGSNRAAYNECSNVGQP
jgi:hypothetical protein